MKANSSCSSAFLPVAVRLEFDVSVVTASSPTKLRGNLQLIGPLLSELMYLSTSYPVKRRQLPFNIKQSQGSHATHPRFHRPLSHIESRLDATRRIKVCKCEILIARGVYQISPGCSAHSSAAARVGRFAPSQGSKVELRRCSDRFQHDDKVSDISQSVRSSKI